MAKKCLMILLLSLVGGVAWACSFTPDTLASPVGLDYNPVDGELSFEGNIGVQAECDGLSGDVTFSLSSFSQDSGGTTTINTLSVVLDGVTGSGINLGAPSASIAADNANFILTDVTIDFSAHDNGNLLIAGTYSYSFTLTLAPN